MKKWIVFLSSILIVFNVYAEKVADLPDVKDPYSISVNGNNFFFVDDFSVFVYSINPCKLKARFGKKGEKSGEFQYRPTLWIHNDSIVVSDYMKTLWFTKGGEFAREKRYTDFQGFEPGMEMQLFPVGGNYVRAIVSHELNRRYVYLLDSRFNQIKKLYEGLFDWNQVGPKMKEFRALVSRIDVLTWEDKIFISDNQKGFLINVFNQKGEHLYTINKDNDVDKVIVTEDFKKKVFEDIRKNRKWLYENVKKDLYTFKEFFPPIKSFRVSDNMIYVMTYKEKENKHEIIILDLKGKILKRVFLPVKSFKYYRNQLELELYTIENGELYEFVKNKGTETWELHLTDIN